MAPSTESVGTVHIDQLLSNLARLYRPTQFIADMVCPYLDVNNESDLYPIFTQGDFYGTDVDDLVADRAEPRLVDISHTNARYETKRRELAWDISDRERKNADSQLYLERNKQLAVMGRLMLKREIRVAALLRKTTNGGGLTNGVSAPSNAVWNSSTLAGIEADVFTGRESLRQAIGIRPNLVIIPEAVAAALSGNTNFAGGLMVYTYGDVNQQPLLSEYYPSVPAVLWGMKTVLPGLIENTANEGQAESYSDVWGKNVVLLYVTGGPALDNPSVAYTFRSEGLTTRTEYQQKPRKTWYAVGQTIDEEVVAPNAGYEITGACT